MYSLLGTNDNYLKRKTQRTKSFSRTRKRNLSQFHDTGREKRFPSRSDRRSMGKRWKSFEGFGMMMEKGRRSSSYLLPVAWPCTWPRRRGSRRRRYSRRSARPRGSLYWGGWSKDPVGRCLRRRRDSVAKGKDFDRLSARISLGVDHPPRPRTPSASASPRIVPLGT